MPEKLDARALALIAAKAACEKKATDVTVQYVAEKMKVTDYVVIATCSSRPQLSAVIDEVREKVREASGRSIEGVEGLSGDTWILLDYGDFVVHAMRPDTREFYRLEGIWNDAPFVDLAAEGIECEPYSERIAGVVEKAGY